MRGRDKWKGKMKFGKIDKIPSKNLTILLIFSETPTLLEKKPKIFRGEGNKEKIGFDTNRQSEYNLH